MLTKTGVKRLQNRYACMKRATEVEGLEVCKNDDDDTLMVCKDDDARSSLPIRHEDIMIN